MNSEKYDIWNYQLKSSSGIVLFVTYHLFVYHISHNMVFYKMNKS